MLPPSLHDGRGAPARWQVATLVPRHQRGGHMTEPGTAAQAVEDEVPEPDTAAQAVEDEVPEPVAAADAEPSTVRAPVVDNGTGLLLALGLVWLATRLWSAHANIQDTSDG